MTNIHERIIARLEYWRSRWCMDLQQHQLDRPEQALSAMIDMAIDDVRRKCPTCKDSGRWPGCDCGRYGYLEECERRLNGN